MKEESKKAYVARVAQANPSQLISLIYEMMEECLTDTEEAIKQGNIGDYQKNMVQFRGFINELMGSLNYEYPISFDLRKIYVWMDKIAVEVLIQKENQKLTHLKDLVAKLKTGFDQVALQDERPAVMEHTQTIYAGLTYGKASLNETMELGNENRGFRA